MTEKLIRCTRCHKEKTLDQMSVDSRRIHKISSWCKECRRKTAQQWQKNNPEKVKAQIRSTPSYESQRNYMYKTRYGITLGTYNTLLEEQRGACAICRKVVDYLLHVDHCHESGEVRGLLCASCNSYLGKIGDDVETLHRAIMYIQKERTK